MAARVLRVVHVGTGGRGRWPLDVVSADPAYESAAPVDVKFCVSQNYRYFPAEETAKSLLGPAA